MCFRRFDAFFSEIVSKASGITKSAMISTLSKKSFIDQLVVEDHVGYERELILVPAVVVGGNVVGMIES